MLFFKNNFKFNVIEDLQRIPQFKFIVKSQKHSQNLKNYYFRCTNSFGAWKKFSIYEGSLSCNLSEKKKTKFLQKAWGHDLFILPVSSNSIEEKLKSKIDQAEKHLDSKRDPRLSSAVVICLTISSENAVMRGNPRGPEFSAILQGKVSPILSCFKNFFSLLKKKE